MNRNKNLRLKPITAAVSTALLMGAGESSMAQDTIDEVVVTGIRGSLRSSMNLKRDAAGVVDAISAEDIGRFPDTNLAESLQRIAGVSIDRINGEGSKVTIRGFSGENNLVLLNGRHMPAAGAFGGNSGAGGARNYGTRSFDFANLASEAVGAIEVYKTGRATIPTGGIGGTVNILTGRPLDSPGLHSTVGVKAVNDTTTYKGDDITPELSGLISWTDDNERFGVSLSASYQERDSGAAGAALNDWNIGIWGEDTLYGDQTIAITNSPADGQVYARPNDVRLSFSDRHRERTNAQLTLQFRPTDALTLTGDYTYAENYLQEHRGEQTFWFNNGNNGAQVEFDTSGEVATPIIFAETSLSGKDNGHEQQWREQENTLDSIGFNADWAITDTFSLNFDVHNSTMDSLPVGPSNSGSIDLSVAAPIHASQSMDFSGAIPIMTTTINDANTNNNGQWDFGDFGTQVGRIWYAAQETEITQARLGGALEFDDGRFEFGVDTRALEMNARQSQNGQMFFGGWGVTDAGTIPADLMEEFSLAAQFDGYNMNQSQQYGIRATDPVEMMRWAIDNADPANGYFFGVNPVFNQNDTLKEDTVAAYFQFSIDGELGGMATNTTLGLRYEHTDVDSTSLVVPPDYLEWTDNNDFQTIRTQDAQPFSVKESYDNLLPSLDFSIDLLDDLKARFSYSKTIARADYGSLSVSASNFGTVGSTYLGTQPTADASNPGLVPLESDNLDLSLEWYYGDASYASVAFFEKRVANFIGTEQVLSSQFGIRDQTNGPRIEAAAMALEGLGVTVDDTTLYTMMAVLDNPSVFPNGAADFVTDASGTNVGEAFHVEVANVLQLHLIPNADVPLMIFSTATPANNREAKLYGAEFSLQHFFGDTGFGVQANYTVVRGDVKFDNGAPPSQSQFALTGLSDTANLVAIYENYGFQARIAYNWRDDFLDETNRGNGNNPTYVESYSQIDMKLSYMFTDQLSVSVEGLNITEEDIRHYGRTREQLWYFQDQGARWQIGAQYSFD